MLRAYEVGETSWGLIRIPLWPSKGAIALGAALLALQYLLDAIKVGVLGLDEAEDEMAEAEAREAAHG